jgi:Alcohol dehydrogenase transcription factor Myb/SANT-like
VVLGQWAPDDCQKLIGAIEKHPVLWKVDHRDYGKRGPGYAAWKDVWAAYRANIEVGRL